MGAILRFILRVCALTGAFVAASALAAPPDLSTPEAQLRALRRIQCSATDGQPVTYYWNGFMFSRVPGEPDRLLFRVEGMNVRQCGPAPNSTNPAEFRLVSREILLYEDPVTGQVLQKWQNPWTGKSVGVLHIANDPVNGNYMVTGRDGRPLKLPFNVLGDQWWLTQPIPLFYTNPLGGDYQAYVGGMYHVAELFNFFGDTADLAGRKPSAKVAIGWQRLSPWLPWMEMGDKPGMLYFHTAGRKLERWDDLPATMKGEIARTWPEYKAPPPLDDARPNETSWTYFRKQHERRKAH